MEEVWNDISLSSIHQYDSSRSRHSRQIFPFQDFFSQKHDEPQNKSTTSRFSAERPSSFACTTLSLSTSESDDTHKKRAKENSSAIVETSDQKSKRLMKSRESADRSRAKRQAYTVKLEQEVSRLRKENAGLRNQISEFYAGFGIPGAPTGLRPDSGVPELIRTVSTFSSFVDQNRVFKTRPAVGLGIVDPLPLV